MIRITLVVLLAIATLLPHSVTAQDRVGFQRQKFDRSRFERPSAAELPNASAPAPTEPAAPAAFSSDSPAQPASESPAWTPRGTMPTEPAAFGDSRPPAASPYGAAADPALQALIAAPKFEDLPTKTFKDPRDYDKLMEIQKETGACLFLYFKNPFVSSESGLCGWYEKHVAGDMSFRKAMRYYLQLEIILPGKKDAQELAAKYKVTKTPALLIIKPDSSFPGRFWPFVKNPGEGMKLEEMPAILEMLKAASTPAYANLF
ncbi:MAG: hypothetical protein RBS84_08040 [Kiritimatiellia bacterium]|jgi:hypothetical protein|nr:hypothetical protein [Kiritimatiellia bacterium]